MPMKKFILAALLLGAIAMPPAPRRPQARRRDQDAAYDADARAAQVRPLREIEARVVPRMGGASYLGPEFDSGAAATG